MPNLIDLTPDTVYGLSREQVRGALPGDVEEFGQSLGVFNTRIIGQDFDVALPRRQQDR